MIHDKILFQYIKRGSLIILFITSFCDVFAHHTLPVTLEDTALIKKYIHISASYDSPENMILDSSLYYITKAQKLSTDLNYEKHIYEINQQFIRLFISSKNYPMALEYSLKNMDLLESEIHYKSDTLIINQTVPLLASIGIIYFQLDIDRSLSYLKKAEKLALENQTKMKNYNLRLGIIYNNIGSVYLQRYELDTAYITYQKALKYLQTDSTNNHPCSAIYNNLGIICMEQEKFQEALQYYEQSLQIRKEINDREGIAQVYNNMGKSFLKQKDYDKAVELLKKSIPISKETRNFRSETIGVQTLSAIYMEKKKYKEAAFMLQREIELKDSIFAQENRGKIIELEIKYEYEKQRKQQELEQQIVLANKEKDTLAFLIIISILFLLSFISILLYINLKTKAKKDKLQADSLTLKSKNLELEKQNLLLQNTKLGQEIENKSKELTTHVMYLVQKNQFIDSVIDKLTELINNDSKQVSKQKINIIIKQMKANVDKAAWEEFEILFQQIHTDFYSKLNKEIPNLTSNERRLCAFLYLNMTTKEISSITFQSIKSIEVARTRLRKKMQIDRDENISAILQGM